MSCLARSLLITASIGMACCSRAAPKVLSLPPAIAAIELPSHPPGASVALREAGKLTVVEVWATWCEGCTLALPEYERMVARHGARGLRVVTINVDKDIGALDRFLEHNSVALPILRDTDERLAVKALQVEHLPSTYLVTGAGEVVLAWAGYQRGQVDLLEREIVSRLSPEQTAP